MTAATITSPMDEEPDQGSPRLTDPDVPQQAGKRRMDPGFSRNMKILGGVLFLAFGVTAVIVMRSQSAIHDAGEKKMPGMVIKPITGESLGASEVTQPDIDRIVRVGQEQSAQASQSGQTFIPNNLPLNSVPTMPQAGNGPGAGYNPNTGRHTGQPGDPQRDQFRDQGLQLQLQSLLKGLEAPGTQSAGPYESKIKDGNSKSADASPATAPINPAPTKQEIVAGLSIHGAVLTSPLDTEKTDYVSARLTTGPAAGGLLFGKGSVVGAEGVRVTFNKLSFQGQAYDVNVVALDEQTSSNALSAEIDRKIFSRYVIPIFGAVGKAYADATARPAQQILIDGGAVGIVTPGATAKQAAAAGIGAGIGKIAEAATHTGPNTAFMPTAAPIGVIFMDAVLQKGGK